MTMTMCMGLTYHMPCAQRLTVDAGVTTIPVSGFYVSPEPPKHLVRFCYCKDDAKLIAACERLEAYFAKPAS